MSKEKVMATKKIANARIHVDRAISRMKVFSILKGTLPITLVPLLMTFLECKDIAKVDAGSEINFLIWAPTGEQV